MKSLKKLSLLTLLLTLSHLSNAQDWSDVISTQRPTLTESSPALTKGLLQFEYGMIRFDGENTFNTVIRYSPLQNIELRAITLYEDDLNFFAGKYTLPLQLPVQFALYGEFQQTGDFSQFRATAFYDWDIFYLSSNYGRYQDTGFGSTQFGYVISDRFIGFSEATFGIMIPEEWQFNTALIYYIKPNWQVDCGLGIDTMGNTYLEIGGGFRFQTQGPRIPKKFANSTTTIDGRSFN